MTLSMKITTSLFLFSHSLVIPTMAQLVKIKFSQPRYISQLVWQKWSQWTNVLRHRAAVTNFNDHHLQLKVQLHTILISEEGRTVRRVALLYFPDKFIIRVHRTLILHLISNVHYSDYQERSRRGRVASYHPLGHSRLRHVWVCQSTCEKYWDWATDTFVLYCHHHHAWQYMVLASNIGPL